MGKLFELLAVDDEVRKRAASTVKELAGLFTTGKGRFSGALRTFQRLREDEEVPELPDEGVLRATSVWEELETLRQDFGAYIDAGIAKEVTNTGTMATVQIGEATFDLPATALLSLEGKLDDLYKLYEQMPVLDPAERWHFDENQGCYVSETRTAQRSAKLPVPLVLYEHTPEHPAQVELIHKDVPTYLVETTMFSGAVTVAERAQILARIRELHKLVTQARQRANDVELVEHPVANAIFDYINEPLHK